MIFYVFFMTSIIQKTVKMYVFMISIIIIITRLLISWLSYSLQ